MTVEPTIAGMPAHHENEGLSAGRFLNLRTAAPSRTVAELMWLHRAVFVDLDPAAGRLRSAPMALNGAYYARPEFIEASLDDLFTDLLRHDAFRATDYDAFLVSLAHHVSELGAIAPFAFGNRRIIALHAEQLGYAAGHRIMLREHNETVWHTALARAFLHRDTSSLVAVLSGTAPHGGAVADTKLGPGGIALLPGRAPPRARRFLKSVKRAREELVRLLPEAQQQVAARLAELDHHGADRAEVEAAQQLVDCLNHDRGPMFMCALLEDVGTTKIEGIFAATQTPVECVYEIVAAMIMALHRLPLAVVERAALAVAGAHYAGGGSPHQDRLADQFLQNSALTNSLDNRFAAGQRLVEAVSSDALLIGSRDAARIDRIIESARQHVATAIRRGDMQLHGVNAAEVFAEIEAALSE